MQRRHGSRVHAQTRRRKSGRTFKSGSRKPARSTARTTGSRQKGAEKGALPSCSNARSDLAQLRSFVKHKAKLGGARVVAVSAQNSSRECSCCPHSDKANRTHPSAFGCRACGLGAHADSNAALNLRKRGRAACQGAERGGRLLAGRSLAAKPPGPRCRQRARALS